MILWVKTRSFAKLEYLGADLPSHALQVLPMKIEPEIAGDTYTENLTASYTKYPNKNISISPSSMIY